MASKFNEIDDNLMIIADILQFVKTALTIRISYGQEKLQYSDVTRAEI